jgi:hypothetical protein
MAGIRDGQQALDALLMQIGAAADMGQDHGQDAVGVLLGDGSGVRGLTARREAERARTAAGLARVGAAMADGLVGVAQVDAITAAAKNLSAASTPRSPGWPAVVASRRHRTWPPPPRST